ncbi:hypothetical protein D3C75_787810 [compost metagenome]
MAHLTSRVAVLVDEAMQSVIGVGRHDDLIDRQTHFLRNEAGIDLGKTRSRDTESHGTNTSSQLQCAVKEKHDLGQNPNPVRGVEANRQHITDWPSSQYPGDKGLAVVETSIDFN